MWPKTVARKRGVQPSFSRRGFTSAPALGDEDDHDGGGGRDSNVSTKVIGWGDATKYIGFLYTLGL